MRDRPYRYPLYASFFLLPLVSNDRYRDLLTKGYLYASLFRGLPSPLTHTVFKMVNPRSELATAAR
jgi:hypothetical protein